MHFDNILRLESRSHKLTGTFGITYEENHLGDKVNINVRARRLPGNRVTLWLHFVLTILKYFKVAEEQLCS